MRYVNSVNYVIMRNILAIAWQNLVIFYFANRWLQRVSYKFIGLVSTLIHLQQRYNPPIVF